MQVYDAQAVESSAPPTHLRRLHAAKVEVRGKLGFQSVHRRRVAQRPLAEQRGGRRHHARTCALPQCGLCKGGDLHGGERVGTRCGHVW